VTPVFEVKPGRRGSRDELASGGPDFTSARIAPPADQNLSWWRQRPDTEGDSLFATTGEMPALAITLELPAYPFRQDDQTKGTREASGRRSRYSTAYALILNTVGTTGLGFVYWAVAAHIYSAKTVGRSSALVSALLLLSALTQLNVSSALQRYLPQAGSSARRLVGYGYAVSSLVALPVAVGFVLLMPRLSSQWAFLSGSRLLALLFVGAALIWGVFALEDAALTGLRRAGVVPVENTVYGVLKLAMLILVAALLPAAGIFASWVAPLIVVIPVINFLIFRKFMPQREQARRQQQPVRGREIVRFTSADYLASLFNQAYGSLLPLMVLSALGAAASGRFYIAWTIAAGPTMIAANFGTSLMVDAAAAPHRLAELTRGIAIRCMVTTLLCSVVIILGAEPILRIYGAQYAAQAASLLVLLSLGSIPRALILLTWSLDRLARRMRRAALTQALLAILLLVGSKILLGRYGIDAVGYAWVGSNVLVALLRLPTLINAAAGGRRKRGKHRAPARAVR